MPKRKLSPEQLAALEELAQQWGKIVATRAAIGDCECRTGCPSSVPPQASPPSRGSRRELPPAAGAGAGSRPGQGCWISTPDRLLEE